MNKTNLLKKTYNKYIYIYVYIYIFYICKLPGFSSQIFTVCPHPPTVRPVAELRRTLRDPGAVLLRSPWGLSVENICNMYTRKDVCICIDFSISLLVYVCMYVSM